MGREAVHDVKAAVEYAKLLKEYAATATDDLHIIMRSVFSSSLHIGFFTFGLIRFFS